MAVTLAGEPGILWARISIGDWQQNTPRVQAGLAFLFGAED
jgi:hypothetical protein